ncbi:hypothetical protein [Polaromonas sp.]|uniref:hypothetical protein n=1 Tax=Polaromonas sp. TaxID=1869339 RepID=UPI00272F2A06|nr:hypothetical protein [Polaromonas sp.]MDP1886862.1 hypothetical protein [Polaromonas sp.]
MHNVDPNDPTYKNLTKRELQDLRYFSREEKESLSIQLFGESLFPLPDWKKAAALRWEALLGQVENEGAAYRITHETLMRLISRKKETAARVSNKPKSIEMPTPTVSSFGDWILRHYSPDRSPEALISGITGERAVVDHRARIRQTKREVPRWENDGWKLIHDGVRGVFDKPYPIPSLTINGQQMMGVPDLVFREKHTGRILIVELKVSSADLPVDGWPNLRAQLWAYSRIALWRTAPEILLAGEVWSHKFSTPTRRQTYFWRENEPSLQIECAELFKAYGGEIADM